MTQIVNKTILVPWKFPYVYTYCSILMMYCFSTGLHTKVAKTPLSLLVLNAEDNSPPGDLTIFFSKLLISCMRLCQVMRNWFSTCLVCQVLLTAEVVSWLPQTISGSGFFVWVSASNCSRHWYVRPVTDFSTLFTVNAFNVFKVGLNLQ